MLSHDLHQEFPQFREKIDHLMATDPNFARLYDQYIDLDNEITQAEDGTIPLDDFTLETLKKKRLKIKDELYQTFAAA